MPTGGKQAIEWIMVLFLAGILGGSLLYTLVKFKEATSNDQNVTDWVDDIIGVLDIVPTWLQILVIVGFSSGIALVGLMIYKYFQKKTESM